MSLSSDSGIVVKFTGVPSGQPSMRTPQTSVMQLFWLKQFCSVLIGEHMLIQCGGTQPMPKRN